MSLHFHPPKSLSFSPCGCYLVEWHSTPKLEFEGTPESLGGTSLFYKMA